MRPEFLGDSYDFVKKDIICWLAPAEEWATHPMYFRPDPVEGFVARHAGFLGISVAEGDINNRFLVSAVGKGCQKHLLLDPDTGLWIGRGRPRRGWNEYISVKELAHIAEAPGREHKLTLVFDQSYSNANYPKRKESAGEKLRKLRCDYDVHSVAYVSHAVFVWVSKDKDLLTSATRRLQKRSRLPRFRFVDDGCKKHVGAELPVPQYEPPPLSRES